MRTPQSHTARENPPAHSALEDRRMPVQAKLAAAWTSVMFLYIYVDYLYLYKPGVIDDLRAGVVFEFDITPTLLTIFVAVIAIPALMVMLSMTLPARVNRATNFVVAPLYTPVSLLEGVGESWDWAFFSALSIGLGVLLLPFILPPAWPWPRRTASPATLAASLDSEPLRTPQQA